MDYVLSKEYKRDLKKLPVEIQSGPEYAEGLYCLFNQKSLPERYKDHALQGNWQGFRDCHIKNDLILIYKIEADTLYFARLNSHSEVFK